MEKQDELAACYRRLATLEPDNISALDDLASEYRRQGKMDEAMASFRAIVEKNPEYARAYTKMAFICYEQNDEPQAVAWFEKAAAAGSGRARQWLAEDEATRRGVVKFADLLKRHNWDEVKPVFIAAYPKYEELSPAYNMVYDNLLALESAKSDMRIVIKRLSNSNYHLSGYKKRPKTKREAKTPYGIEFADWAKWLGMDIDRGTMEDYSDEEIIAHCLWEMTFNGFTQEDIKAKGDPLFNYDYEASRRKEIDAFPKINDNKNETI
jgi:tetratricopeptide (TPR) repeat protein